MGTAAIVGDVKDQDVGHQLLRNTTDIMEQMRLVSRVSGHPETCGLESRMNRHPSPGRSHPVDGARIPKGRGKTSPTVEESAEQVAVGGAEFLEGCPRVEAGDPAGLVAVAGVRRGDPLAAAHPDVCQR